MIAALSSRFSDKVAVHGSGCWEWVGAKTNGYGVIGTRGNRIEKAHRISYMLHKGDFPQHLCICHTCDNPGCVNPDHLFVGSHKENSDDKIAKGRYVCKPVRGADQGLAKLTENSVRRIRIVAGALPLRKLAELFGVSPKSILNVVQRKTWSHVK